MSPKNDSTCQCQICQRKERCNFAHCLSRGWPRCCGKMMLLTEKPTKEDVKRAMDQLMAPVVAVREVLK